MCADHMVCMACMVCSHHPNHTFDTVTTPCRWHVNRQRGRKKRERRGSSLMPSPFTAHPAGTHHHPSSPLLPLSSPLLISRPHPQHTLTPSPPLICLTTTSTSLLLSLNLPLLTHTHTHTSQASPNACASAQRKRSSSSSSPTARVHHHHHHQPMSSSTCMPHLSAQAAKWRV